MRCTQFIGLTNAAEKFINQHAKRAKIKTCPTCGHRVGGEYITICGHRVGGEYITIKIGEVEGMFGEIVSYLKEYIDRATNRKFEEFEQAISWSSGPMIFTALLWTDTKKLVKGCGWKKLNYSKEGEIVNAEKGIYYV